MQAIMETPGVGMEEVEVEEGAEEQGAEGAKETEDLLEEAVEAEVLGVVVHLRDVIMMNVMVCALRFSRVRPPSRPFIQTRTQGTRILLRLVLRLVLLCHDLYPLHLYLELQIHLCQSLGSLT